MPSDSRVRRDRPDPDHDEIGRVQVERHCDPWDGNAPRRECGGPEQQEQSEPDEWGDHGSDPAPATGRGKGALGSR